LKSAASLTLSYPSITYSHIIMWSIKCDLRLNIDNWDWNERTCVWQWARVPSEIRSTWWIKAMKLKDKNRVCLSFKSLLKCFFLSEASSDHFILKLLFPGSPCPPALP
jgi:hypothetical protein